MRAIGLAGAMVILAAVPALAADDAVQANWDQVVACAKEASDSRRHACIDAVLDRAGVLVGSQERAAATVEEQRQVFGLSVAQQEAAERRAAPAPVPAPPVAPPAPAPVPAARAPAPAPIPAPAPRPAVPPRQAQVDRLETTVSRAFDPGNRLLVIVTQEGQIWQQNESKDIGLPPREGTAFIVEKGTLGSFTCKIGSGRSFRCRRQG